MRQKRLHVQITKAVSNNYDAQFIVSSTDVDRVGDTFTTSALKKLSRIRKLIALWQHKADQPCGYWENFKVQGNKLVANLKLADTNLGQMIKALLDSGVPLGASVGFIGLEHEPNKSGGYEYDDVDLMEISVVSTPANQNAVLLAKQFGFDESVFTSSKDANGLSDSEKREAIALIKSSIMRIEKCQQSQRS